MVVGKLDVHIQKNEVTLYHKGKLIQKGLNLRPKTIKLPKEDIREELNDIGFGYDFLYMTPKAQTKKAKIGT